MKDVEENLTGILIGVAILVGGVSLFLWGLTQPGVSVCCDRYGAVGGNLPEILGIILTLAGVATVSGTLSIAIRKWEGGDDGLPDD